MPSLRLEIFDFVTDWHHYMRALNCKSVGSVITVYRSLVFILLTAALPVSVSGKTAAGEFYLSVTMVTGEHSRDSNSTTTSLTIKEDILVYEESYHGAHSNRRPPLKKEYKLSSEDIAALTRVLRDKDLLATRTLSGLTPEQVSSRYFELKIRSKVNGKEHLISIEGPRDAIKLKEERTYKNSLYLIEQLYKIIDHTDPDLMMPALIN